jgi:hypothetical protein
MLKTENPIIFTCFDDEPFTNNKGVLLPVSAKG